MFCLILPLCANGQGYNIQFNPPAAGGGGGGSLTFEDASTTNSVEASNVTTHTVDTTADTIAAGDLVFVITCLDNNGGGDIGFTCPSGWTKVDVGPGQGNGGDGVICYFESTGGTEDEATIDIVSNSTQQSSSHVLVFNGQDATTPVTCSAVTNNVNSDDAISTALAVGDAGDIMLRIFCADQGAIVTDTTFASECITSGTAGENRAIRESANGTSAPGSSGFCIDDTPTASAVTWTGVFSEGTSTVESTGISCRIED